MRTHDIWRNSPILARKRQKCRQIKRLEPSMTASLFPKADTRPPGKLGSSKMYAQFQTFDWSGTALGAVDGWPTALTMTLRMMFSSPVAMAVLAGRDGVMIYNDAYIEIAGKRHPDCFGQSVLTTWPEVAAFNRQIIADVFAGETASFEDAPLTLYRNGVAEDVWLDLDYSPVVDDDGGTIAVLAILAETTKRVKRRKPFATTRNACRWRSALPASSVSGTGGSGKTGSTPTNVFPTCSMCRGTLPATVRRYRPISPPSIRMISRALKRR